MPDVTTGDDVRVSEIMPSITRLLLLVALVPALACREPAAGPKVDSAIYRLTHSDPPLASRVETPGTVTVIDSASLLLQSDGLWELVVARTVYDDKWEGWKSIPTTYRGHYTTRTNDYRLSVEYWHDVINGASYYTNPRFVSALRLNDGQLWIESFVWSTARFTPVRR